MYGEGFVWSRASLKDESYVDFLFKVSIKQNLVSTEGVCAGVPGGMCGCVWKMAVITAAACTESGC